MKSWSIFMGLYLQIPHETYIINMSLCYIFYCYAVSFFLASSCWVLLCWVSLCWMLKSHCNSLILCIPCITFVHQLLRQSLLTNRGNWEGIQNVLIYSYDKSYDKRAITTQGRVKKSSPLSQYDTNTQRMFVRSLSDILWKQNKAPFNYHPYS